MREIEIEGERGKEIEVEEERGRVIGRDRMEERGGREIETVSE